MQISSIIDVVEGNLINSPSISFIYDIKTQLNKIHEGDLFIAKNPNDIGKAIQKGAFGILYDFETQIIDNEIAWIKVNNLERSMSKLIRYKLSNLDLKAYFCNKVTFELLNSYVKLNNENIKLLPDDLSSCFNILENIDNNNTIICSNKELLDDIYPNNIPFNKENYIVKNLVEHSLFETTFSCGDYYFPRIKLPSLYINNFIGVYNFLDNKLDINKLKRISCFKPTFVDKYFEITDYGHSNKFIIAQEDVDVAKKEILYLQDKYKYANILIAVSSDLSLYFGNADYYFNDLLEIKDFAINKKFNALYVVGASNENILKIVEKSQSKSLL